jgi:hypothetical protein
MRGATEHEKDTPGNLWAPPMQIPSATHSLCRRATLARVPGVRPLRDSSAPRQSVWRPLGSDSDPRTRGRQPVRL